MGTEFVMFIYQARLVCAARLSIFTRYSIIKHTRSYPSSNPPHVQLTFVVRHKPRAIHHGRSVHCYSKQQRFLGSKAASVGTVSSRGVVNLTTQKLRGSNGAPRAKLLHQEAPKPKIWDMHDELMIRPGSSKSPF